VRGLARIIGKRRSTAARKPERRAGSDQAAAITDWFIPNISPCDFESPKFEIRAVVFGRVMPLKSAINGTTK
jgi:hypothetical protein